MPYFGKQSERILSTCDERIQRVCCSVIQYTDFSVIYGVRSRYKQNELFRQGFSKVRYPNSKHNKRPSLAVDLAPYPIDWKDIRRFDLLAGHILQAGNMMEIELRWGGNWDGDNELDDQTFNDLGHYELV